MLLLYIVKLMDIQFRGRSVGLSAIGRGAGIVIHETELKVQNKRYIVLRQVGFNRLDFARITNTNPWHKISSNLARRQCCMNVSRGRATSSTPGKGLRIWTAILALCVWLNRVEISRRPKINPLIRDLSPYFHKWLSIVRG